MCSYVEIESEVCSTDDLFTGTLFPHITVFGAKIKCVRNKINSHI